MWKVVYGPDVMKYLRSDYHFPWTTTVSFVIPRACDLIQLFEAKRLRHIFQWPDC
jgi:hypothetical protein